MDVTPLSSNTQRTESNKITMCSNRRPTEKEAKHRTHWEDCQCMETFLVFYSSTFSKFIFTLESIRFTLNKFYALFIQSFHRIDEQKMMPPFAYHLSEIITLCIERVTFQSSIHFCIRKYFPSNTRHDI